MTVRIDDPRLPERFWEKVYENETTGCWEWKAAGDDQGYGRFGIGRTVHLAHRVAYEALVGPIPAGLVTDHLCRNPACVNPAHIEPVTHRENSRRGTGWGGRMGRAGRLAARTHCIHGHEFTDDNTYTHPKRGTRECRACANERRARYAARQKEKTT